MAYSISEMCHKKIIRLKTLRKIRRVSSEPLCVFKKSLKLGSQPTTHHLQQSQIIPEWSQDSDEWNYKHDDSQDDEDHSRGQKHSLQCLVALPLHLGIDANGQNEATY